MAYAEKFPTLPRIRDANYNRLVTNNDIHMYRRRFFHSAYLVTFRRFDGATVWFPIEITAYDLEWPVGDLATQLFGSDGMSNG